jgi:hypothetical protein
MTVTRTLGQDNRQSPEDSPTVIRSIHAVGGLLLALAAFISAITGLIIALMGH